MGDLYRNVGAPIRRNGEVVARRGDVFEPTEDERARKAYKLRRVTEDTRTNRRPQRADAPKDPLEDYALGGGWYLIGGEKVQGRQAAEEAIRAQD